ncbi:MAG: hypothetical protein U0984_00145 [Prosthecobacter sp.]|nr:hypothetical protein [Prosthecobacter sp.]
MSPAERIDQIRRAFPKGGMFRDKEWVMSPDAFPLGAEVIQTIEALGPALRAFQRACNRLYFESLDTDELSWVAKWLDQGKPAAVIELGRHDRWRQELPRVLRPDLVLTETGVAIAELDSLPGGIGLTGWLNETYAALGQAVLGGAEGMLEGFAAAFPHEDILISRESGDYQPEMEWLAGRLNERSPGPPRRVLNSWNLAAHELAGLSFYRFFELFDLDNVELSAEMLRLARQGEVSFTPPLKAFLEEKLWLALFWSPQLQEWWSRELSRDQLTLLQRCIPRGWIMNPEPLPAIAVYPRLNIHSWQEAKRFGGKQRELALKISGFSERGWGSRGVFIGHDLSQEQWAAALDEALASFSTNPFVLQEFHRAKVVNHPAWHEDLRDTTMMQSRVRLCPYYFVSAGTEETQLGGVLATVCPADKKILHGMRDAMMLPCVAA